MNQSARIFEQETKLYNEKVPDFDWLLEVWWGLWADHYVPVPHDVSTPQEVEKFLYLENGEPMLAPVRTDRLNRFILKYLKLNNLQESADVFVMESGVTEKSGDGDNLLDAFWIPCMCEQKMISISRSCVSLRDTDTSTRVVEQYSSPSVLDNSDFSFEKLMTIHKELSFRILASHFSTDGKLLAYAGTRKVVSIWDVAARVHVAVFPELPHYITDIRFRPRSHKFAASSYDGIIYYWKTVKVIPQPSSHLIGHHCPVLTLDFCPRYANLLCSGDSHGEIRVWDIDTSSTLYQYQECDVGINRLRFNSMSDLLAVTTGTRISIMLVLEKDKKKITLTRDCYLEGHSKEIKDICWDPSGRHLASVSRERALVWASTDGIWKSEYELDSGGYAFHSCLFQPTNSQLLVIGSYIDIQLWDYTRRSRSRTFKMENPTLISSLSGSLQSGVIASTSDELTIWRC